MSMNAYDEIKPVFVDGNYRYGGLAIKDLAATKKDFRENAVKVLAATGADHAVYCHIAYNEAGEITGADFYSNLTMDDTTFYERTREIPGTDYIGAVHKGTATPKTKELLLIHKGRDNWERPVYECDGRLYVDVDPRKGRKPEICTKNGNEFYGEPDTPIPEGAKVTFVPCRDEW